MVQLLRCNRHVWSRTGGGGGLAGSQYRSGTQAAHNPAPGLVVIPNQQRTALPLVALDNRPPVGQPALATQLSCM
jgi:hypothetical protein